jgi:hypothetical protein
MLSHNDTFFSFSDVNNALRLLTPSLFQLIAEIVSPGRCCSPISFLGSGECWGSFLWENLWSLGSRLHTKGHRLDVLLLERGIDGLLELVNGGLGSSGHS